MNLLIINLSVSQPSQGTGQARSSSCWEKLKEQKDVHILLVYSNASAIPYYSYWTVRGRSGPSQSSWALPSLPIKTSRR
ncbi:hypothetical protein PoB_007361900 [Plakobranchus ocellatus]|uniref:Uncharacterized protein n=1 Tax=Plakobranchus ocellatus TaxID=259542 RepID=A0AAV4DSX5_9GAST|nr:hypothetical protein PoB_007361900 [Plakobranchus ocellatus]